MVEVQASMLVYCRYPVEHTVLRSRDEHDGVCGLWLLLVDVGVVSLINERSFGENACGRVCVCGDGNVRISSEAQHTSCEHRRQAELRCRQARDAMRLCARPRQQPRSIRARERLLFGARSPQTTRR
jgi:Na+-transporting NADH:ubiquinone oxidoreductase subunit NqrF